MRAAMHGGSPQSAVAGLDDVGGVATSWRRSIRSPLRDRLKLGGFVSFESRCDTARGLHVVAGTAHFIVLERIAIASRIRSAPIQVTLFKGGSEMFTLHLAHRKVA